LAGTTVVGSPGAGTAITGGGAFAAGGGAAAIKAFTLWSMEAVKLASADAEPRSPGQKRQGREKG